MTSSLWNHPDADWSAPFIAGQLALSGWFFPTEPNHAVPGVVENAHGEVQKSTQPRFSARGARALVCAPRARARGVPRSGGAEPQAVSTPAPWHPLFLHLRYERRGAKLVL